MMRDAEVKESMADVEIRVAELVEEARGGNRVAASELIGLFRKEIFRMIYYRIFSEADAEDVTQEVFVAMMKGLERLKETEKFRSWLYAIAINKVRDYKRKERFLSLFGRWGKEETGSIVCNSDDPAQVLEGKQFMKGLQSFMLKLPEGEREVFSLRFLDHLGIREIASTLNKGESTVKTHLYRALQKFRGDDAIQDILGKGDLS